MKLLIGIACLLAAGCGKLERKHDPKDPKNPLSAAQAKAEVYQSLLSESRDAQGFVHDKCDGLLFTTLLAIGRGSVDEEIIMQAQGTPGRWYRHALHDCYATGGSGSDISQDMLWGLAFWAWQFQKPQVVSDVIAYGVKHNWQMGDGDVFRTIMRPTLISTFYSLSREMGKSVILPAPESEMKQVGLDLELPLPKGFEAHLQVLSIVLRSNVLGGASDLDVETLRKQKDREPRNALYQAAYHLFTDGDQTEAASLLADDGLFPADRLPTVDDRCAEYLYQRDEAPENWQPCSGKTDRPHSGTDLLFALAVAENKLRKK